MRLIFMGTPEFAVPTLEALLKKGHDFAAIFTQPDRPAGRGRGMAFSPVKQKALERDLPVHQPETLKSIQTVQTISSLKPEALVVVAYGLFLPQSILDIPRHGAVNLHPSLLPKYRGAAPINHALLNGDKVTGITTIMMNDRMDAGDIILQEETEVDDDQNAGQLEDRLAKLGADLIVRSLETLGSGGTAFRRQDESEVTFAPKLSPGDGRIDWNRRSREIQNQVRGLTPRPGAFTMFRDKRLGIMGTEIYDDPSPTVHNCSPGQMTAIVRKKGPAIMTGDGALVLLKVKPQGKKEMSGDEFIRGYRPALGEGWS